MGSNGLWTELMSLSDVKIGSVISAALDEYYQMLANIGQDIYNSCTQDFYAQYQPEVYTRHGDLVGSNLYGANKIFYDGNTVNVILNEYNIQPYGKQDKREMVFTDFFLVGLRGGPLPKRPDFPMDWYTKYPNSYSKYHIWKSEKVILQDILDDFCANVVKETLPIVIGKIAKKI